MILKIWDVQKQVIFTKSLIRIIGIQSYMYLNMYKTTERDSTE